MLISVCPGYSSAVMHVASLACLPLQAMATRGQLQCELPNANLHHFQGRFKFVADEGEC